MFVFFVCLLMRSFFFPVFQCRTRRSTGQHGLARQPFGSLGVLYQALVCGHFEYPIHRVASHNDCLVESTSPSYHEYARDR
jgi:hypothetical protein